MVRAWLISPRRLPCGCSRTGPPGRAPAGGSVLSVRLSLKVLAEGVLVLHPVITRCCTRGCSTRESSPTASATSGVSGVT
jgi:hypothetical protein